MHAVYGKPNYTNYTNNYNYNDEEQQFTFTSCFKLRASSIILIVIPSLSISFLDYFNII